MNAPGPGPNDFHIDNGIQKPGLGKDEPSVKMRSQMLATSVAEQERLAALDRAEKMLQTEAEALEDKRTELEDRERALALREAALEAAAGITDDKE